MKPVKLATLTRHFAAISIASALCVNAAYADMNSFFQAAGQRMSAYTLDCGHWYAGGNIGVSHLHDNANTGSGNSVTENGPGWSVQGGYQFNSLLGTELGFTQYHYSSETANSTNTSIAETEHYSVDLAATGRYPMMNQLSALGKLGIAYNYARKVATGGGAGSAKAAQAGSLYWGLGVDYSLTTKVDVIAQFAEAVGNHLTGSADLWSLGLNVAIV